jgi:virginiamycin B lyase
MMLSTHSGRRCWTIGLVAASMVGCVVIGIPVVVSGFGRTVAAAPVSDIVEVKFDEWMTPSVRPFHHDPAAARDGSAWYTAQLSNAVGRLNPATGQFREFSLPTPNSGPHGLLEDPDGNIWYTGNAAGLIGRIEPKTGKVTEYKMPDPKARDPHSLVWSRSGSIFFTVQGGGFVGTLDPRTGKIALVALAGGSAPYGIVVNSKDVPFFDEFGTNKIGSLDPKTLKVTEYPLPAAGARPRRITVGRDDAIYYTDYARGYLGHLDPATGKVVEFQSPGGADARPYAITTASDGTIWYCETGESNRNVLVRFNPETKKILSWPIPSGGGTVRNMDVWKGPAGEVLWLAESGVGKLARVAIRTVVSP